MNRRAMCQLHISKFFGIFSLKLRSVDADNLFCWAFLSKHTNQFHKNWQHPVVQPELPTARFGHIFPKSHGIIEQQSTVLSVHILIDSDMSTQFFSTHSYDNLHLHVHTLPHF